MTRISSLALQQTFCGIRSRLARLSSALLVVALMTGCAATLDKNATSLDLTKESIVVMSMRMTNAYRIGTRINIDVLNAQQQLHAAQRDLFKARTDTLLHSLRLKAAVGELHADALQALNQLLVTDGAGAVNNPPTSSPTP